MSLKELIKHKICLITMTPNYPLRNFVGWAESLNVYLLLHYLNKIQEELEQEQQTVALISQAKNIGNRQVLTGYWCFYCEQIRDYYRAIIRDPSCKDQMAFLL